RRVAGEKHHVLNVMRSHLAKGLRYLGSDHVGCGDEPHDSTIPADVHTRPSRAARRARLFVGKAAPAPSPHANDGAVDAGLDAHSGDRVEALGLLDSNPFGARV